MGEQLRLLRMVRTRDERRGCFPGCQECKDLSTVPSLLYQITVHQCPWYPVVGRSLKKTTSSGVCVCVCSVRVEGMACLMAVLHV